MTRRAVDILEAAPASAGSQGMWAQLSKLALRANDFTIAQRCFSALGDVSKTEFLRQIAPLAEQHVCVVC